jgi:hypothetical protein
MPPASTLKVSRRTGSTPGMPWSSPVVALLLPQIGQATVSRAAQLLQRLNALLPW